MARKRERVRLEDGRKLDLNLLIRQGLARPGASWGGTIRWAFRYSGKDIEWAWVSGDMTDESRGWLRIGLGVLDQTIDLIALARHFGGRQWYFICRQTGRRVSVLWKPPGARFFASRQTWGRQVAYNSQFESPHDRALSAAQDIRYRLAGKEYVSTWGGISPPKPKGMHWRTYDRIMKRCEAYEEKDNSYILKICSRPTRHGSHNRFRLPMNRR
jgi:hypothetical protein